MLSFALGQALAIALAMIPLLAKWLGSIGFPGAIAQVGLGYFWMLLLLFYVQPWKTGLSNPLYLYLLVGVMDFESNFCISEAFGLIPPIIARLMLNLTLPLSFFLEFIAQGKLPSSVQVLGLVLVLVGVVLAAASPVTLAAVTDRTQAAKGLLFAMASTFLGALSGLSQKTLMRGKDKHSEMVACMSVSAVLVAAVQLPPWEVERYKNLENPGAAVAGIAAISVLIFAFYFGSIHYNRRFPHALPFNLLTINAHVFMGELLVFGNWEVAEPMLAGAFILTVGGGLVVHLSAAEKAEAAQRPESFKALDEEGPLLEVAEN